MINIHTIITLFICYTNIVIANPVFFNWGQKTPSISQSNIQPGPSVLPKTQPMSEQGQRDYILRALQKFESTYPTIKKETDPKKSDKLKIEMLNLACDILKLDRMFDVNDLNKEPNVPTVNIHDHFTATVRPIFKGATQEELRDLNRLLLMNHSKTHLLLYLQLCIDYRSIIKSEEVIEHTNQYFQGETAGIKMIHLAYTYLMERYTLLSSEISQQDEKYKKIIKDFFASYPLNYEEITLDMANSLFEHLFDCPRTLKEIDKKKLDILQMPLMGPKEHYGKYINYVYNKFKDRISFYYPTENYNATTVEVTIPGQPNIKRITN
jgi:hypothetical protein